MPLRPDLKRKLIGLLKKFKLEEFHVLVSLVFPNISVNQIHEVLDDFRCDLTSQNVAEVIAHLYDGTSPNMDDCEKALCMVYLSDAAFHNTLTWGVAELMDEVNELPEKLSDLNKVILSSYRSKALNANVHSMLHKNVVWSVIAERKILKKGGVRLGSANFFGYRPDLERPHVLFRPKTMDKDLHLQVYIESLGYKNYRLLNYEGPNTSAMFNVIERTCNEALDVVPLSHYEQGNEMVVRKNGWNDYSEAFNRSAYAKRIFSNPSGHKYITVECEELHADNRPTSASTIADFYSTMEFSCKNCSLEDMFQHMVEIGDVDFPLPNYMLCLSSTPDNVIALQTKNSL